MRDWNSINNIRQRKALSDINNLKHHDLKNSRGASRFKARPDLLILSDNKSWIGLDGPCRQGVRAGSITKATEINYTCHNVVLVCCFLWRVNNKRNLAYHPSGHYLNYFSWYLSFHSSHNSTLEVVSESNFPSQCYFFSPQPEGSHSANFVVEKVGTMTIFGLCSVLYEAAV